MRKIIALELVGQDKLDYDLYDEKGNILYNTGEDLTPDLLMKLNYISIYKKEGFEIGPIENYREPEKVIEEKALLTEKAAKNLLKNSRTIIKTVYEGEAISTEECEEATDLIIEEVGNNIDDIECLTQLRVFDSYTFSHTVNVSTMSTALGMHLKLDEKQIKELAMGALLHDIGKMRVPKEILNKPTRLEPEEFEVMKSHTTLGYEYIKNNMDVTESIARVTTDHQERFGGGGYPFGYKGQEISLYGQITAIVDVYDALVSDRVYKKGMTSAEAIKIMLSMGGRSFNPSMLYKFAYLANHKNTTEIVE